MMASLLAGIGAVTAIMAVILSIITSQYEVPTYMMSVAAVDILLACYIRLCCEK